MSDPEHIFLAFTDPREGMEDEYNEWYDNVHVPDTLLAPGWIAAQRYRLTDGQQRDGQEPYWKYLVIYEIDADAADILKNVDSTPPSGPRSNPKPSMWADGSRVWTYSKFGPRVTK